MKRCSFNRTYCFKKSAKPHKAMKNNHRTANDYVEAAKCYKKVDGHGL